MGKKLGGFAHFRSSSQSSVNIKCEYQVKLQKFLLHHVVGKGQGVFNRNYGSCTVFSDSIFFHGHLNRFNIVKFRVNGFLKRSHIPQFLYHLLFLHV